MNDQIPLCTLFGDVKTGTWEEISSLQSKKWRVKGPDDPDNRPSTR
jgi:hypothetical protein